MNLLLPTKFSRRIYIREVYLTEYTSEGNDKSELKLNGRPSNVVSIKGKSYMYLIEVKNNFCVTFHIFYLINSHYFEYYYYY